MDQLPKDVLVLILKQLSLKQLLDMRLINKHFNNTVKQKFKRLWFKKYIEIMIKTGDYALKYGVPVKQIHSYYAYLKEIDMKIPYVHCYGIYDSHCLFRNYRDDYDKFEKEAIDVLSEKFPGQESLTLITMYRTKKQLFFKDDFIRVYAFTKILNQHCEIKCTDRTHFVWDIPKDETDDEWFNTHEIAYDPGKCYMSSYLLACYRIVRDRLLREKPGDMKLKTKSKTLKKEYTSSPFYRKPMLTYKCI
jgi:hypothetical protein